MKNQKTIISLVAIFIIIAFIAGANFYKKKKQEKFGFLASKKSELFIRDYSPSLGNPKAKVFITEFLDPQCESCRSFYPHVKSIMAAFPGKVKLIIRYTPLHSESRFAVRILEAARKQGKFWESLEILFKYQPNWGGHHQARPELIWDYLPLVGVDIQKIKQDMNDPGIQKILEQDIADGKELGVRMTPTFFVNGKPLTSFGYEQLKELVAQEVALSEKP